MQEVSGFFSGDWFLNVWHTKSNLSLLFQPNLQIKIRLPRQQIQSQLEKAVFIHIFLSRWLEDIWGFSKITEHLRIFGLKHKSNITGHTHVICSQNITASPWWKYTKPPFSSFTTWHLSNHLNRFNKRKEADDADGGDSRFSSGSQKHIKGVRLSATWSSYNIKILLAGEHINNSTLWKEPFSWWVLLTQYESTSYWQNLFTFRVVPVTILVSEMLQLLLKIITYFRHWINTRHRAINEVQESELVSGGKKWHGNITEVRFWMQDFHVWWYRVFSPLWFWCFYIQ